MARRGADDAEGARCVQGVRTMVDAKGCWCGTGAAGTVGSDGWRCLGLAGARQTHLELSAIRHRSLHRRLRHPLQGVPVTSQRVVLACGGLAGERNLHGRARRTWAEVWGEIWAGPAGRGFVSAGGRRRVGARRLVRGAYLVLGQGFDPCDLRVLGDGGAPGGLGRRGVRASRHGRFPRRLFPFPRRRHCRSRRRHASARCGLRRRLHVRRMRPATHRTTHRTTHQVRLCHDADRRGTCGRGRQAHTVGAARWR